MYWLVARPCRTRPLEQIGRAVVLVHQLMAELPRDAEDAERPHRVDEQRMRAVEGIDVTQAAWHWPIAATAWERRCRDQRAACTAPLALIASLVEVQFPLVVRDASLPHQSAEIAVGGEVVEAVIVHADVGDVRWPCARRCCFRPSSSSCSIAGRVERQDCAAVLKALRPFRPAARGVFAFDREDRRAFG